jgi:hypothetical protein
MNRQTDARGTTVYHDIRFVSHVSSLSSTKLLTETCHRRTKTYSIVIDAETTWMKRLSR